MRVRSKATPSSVGFEPPSPLGGEVVDGAHRMAFVPLGDVKEAEMNPRREGRRAAAAPDPAQAGEERFWTALLGPAAIRDEHLVLLVNGGPGLAAAFLASVNPGRLGSRAKRRDRSGVGLYAIEEDPEKRAEVWRLFDADLPFAYEGRILGDPPERFPAVVSGGFDRAVLVAVGLEPERAARRVLCVCFLLGPGGRLVALLDSAATDAARSDSPGSRLARWAELNGAEVSFPEGRESRARVLVADR